MPVYEYECVNCYTRFERRQSVTEQPVQECPDCGGPVRRVYYPVGIVFKGSGFYCTDNRKDKYSGSDSSTMDKDSSKKESKKEPATAGKSSK